MRTADVDFASHTPFLFDVYHSMTQEQPTQGKLPRVSFPLGTSGMFQLEGFFVRITLMHHMPLLPDWRARMCMDHRRHKT